MDPLIYSLVSSSESATVWLLRWSWQALLLLSSVCLVVKGYRSQAPAFRHYIWLCGLVAVATLPFWDAVAGRLPLLQPPGSAFISVLDMPAVVIARLPVAAVESAPASTQAAASGGSFSIWLALSVVWVCGVLFALARLVRDHLSLRRARRRGRRTSLVELGCAVLDPGSSANGACIVLSSEVSSPVLAGVLRPAIL